MTQFTHRPGGELPGPLSHQSFGGKQGKILFSDIQRGGMLCKVDGAHVQREKALFLGVAVRLRGGHGWISVPPLLHQHNSSNLGLSRGREESGEKPRLMKFSRLLWPFRFKTPPQSLLRKIRGSLCRWLTPLGLRSPCPLGLVSSLEIGIKKNLECWLRTGDIWITNLAKALLPWSSPLSSEGRQTIWPGHFNRPGKTHRLHAGGVLRHRATRPRRCPGSWTTPSSGPGMC